MKPQEIFNRAAVHLMGMDGPSLDQNADACVYRGKDADCEFNGQMCAVGLFIKDEHYSPYLEGTGITGNQLVADAVAASWEQEHLTDAQLMLLADLQMAHDDTSRDDVESIKSRKWRDGIVAALDGVATKHHLRFDPKGSSA
jgi:hypothetical protein